MPKISGHEHGFTQMDGTCNDGRVYLQNRENMKQCTGGGPVREPPILKSNVWLSGARIWILRV